jgi:inner membrane protein
MDSLSQIALGAAVSVAVMGRRTAVWKAALLGAVAGTLPDLDVLIDQGDPIRNMVLHRAESHSLFWLTLFSLPFSAAVARLLGEWTQFQRWWLALWLALVTHPLLDAMTVYGTQLGLPFTNTPYGVGSVFIIDPLYTVPLLVGGVWALATRGAGLGLKANATGLVLSTAYLAWGVAAQQMVTGLARDSLAANGVTAERLLVTPTAFNTVLWRVVAVTGDTYREGYYSLLDPASTGTSPRISFEAYPRNNALAEAASAVDGVQRLRAFTHGFYAMRRDSERVLISDLRMGQEPAYTFTFAVATGQGAALTPLIPAQQLGSRADLDCALPWLGRRLRGEALPGLAVFCSQK